jgi:Asp-tRNA(Asn)/Glu-tRNA(Gln) amidotransferase A subunit family amidase
MSYIKQPMKAPRLSKGALRMAVRLMEGPLAGPLRKKTLSDMGIDVLRNAAIDVPIAFGPRLPAGDDDGSRIDLDRIAGGRDRLAAKPTTAKGFAPETIADFAHAYRSLGVSPVDVAERVLAASAETARHDPPLHVFIAQERDDVLRQAEASLARHRRGEAKGPLDGVPVAVKDEVDMLPYPTTVGTAYLGRNPARHDATVVTRLRDAGAVLIGKANMHEIGITPTGLNPHKGACRNPHDPRTDPGGSSSGSAAAVAAGLSPLAVGADGGGSIRIPAAFCGVVGLKATWGRVSEHGAFPLCWSVGHLGPLAATATDCAIGYAALAGRDVNDAQTLRQPAPTLDGFDRDDLDGVRIGVYSPWFDDADPDIVQSTRAMLGLLAGRGATVVEIVIPELELMQLAHVLTIVSEMRGAVLPHLTTHRREMGLNVRMILSLAEAITSSDYVIAQRIRTLFCDRFDALYRNVDVIATPTTGCTAPVIRNDALPDGESDIPLIDNIMRFVRPGNFLGLPAISFPCGYDRDGRPIGFQAMGRAWDEALLLRMARIAESMVERREPVFYRRQLPQ